MTFIDLWGNKNLIKHLRLYYVSIHRNLCQNRFINECTRKTNAKIIVWQSQSFLWDIEEVTFLTIKKLDVVYWFIVPARVENI